MFDTDKTPEITSATDCGAELQASFRAQTIRMAVWLDVLGRFDADSGWAIDGQPSCASWLMWRADLPRATAHELVRIAAELRQRPIVAAAFHQAWISYDAVEVLTRVKSPAPDADRALVEVAKTRPVEDVERAVRHYRKQLGGSKGRVNSNRAGRRARRNRRA